MRVRCSEATKPDELHPQCRDECPRTDVRVASRCCYRGTGGAIYALLGVRSPAPPVIALIGLLSMMSGEEAVDLAMRLSSPRPAVARPREPESITIEPDTLEPSRAKGLASPGY